jgi:hypothetical protein
VLISSAEQGIKNATSPLRIMVVRAEALQGICSLVLW